MHESLISPSQQDFTDRYNQGESVLVWTRLIADLETPVSASLKLMKTGEPAFLLESVEGGATRGRYSMIGLKPDLLWRSYGNKAEVCYNPLSQGFNFSPCEEDALISLRQLIKDSQLEIPASLPPMSSGLIGHIGYDAVRLMERLPDSNPDTLGIPDSYLMRPQVMIVFDSVADVMYLITVARPGSGMTAKDAYNAACLRLETTSAQLDTTLNQAQRARDNGIHPIEFTSNFTREAYHQVVERAKEYIRAGDIFQVVPSQRFTAPFEHSPFSLYRSLRHLNPSPFLVYLSFPDYALVASSPEILVRLRDNVVTIRPIAGTRKRGVTPAEDRALAEDLLSDPKECAEHLMLLDLGRNDVGRVAQTGSVHVTEEMIIEYYSHVMHIVSNVEGELAEGADAVDALIAGFPAGTVSGAPKIRAMEIIDELEPVRRSFYGGCIGYFSANGSMDTCIALRTALLKDGQIYLQAGGGVVADSDPEAEYQETCNKARALMHAAEKAANYDS